MPSFPTELMMTATNSCACKGGKERGEVKGEYGKVCGEENAEYEGMVQPSKQHFAPCVKEVEWRLGTRGNGARSSITPVLEN